MVILISIITNKKMHSRAWLLHDGSAVKARVVGRTRPDGPRAAQRTRQELWLGLNFRPFIHSLNAADLLALSPMIPQVATDAEHLFLRHLFQAADYGMAVAHKVVAQLPARI